MLATGDNVLIAHRRLFAGDELRYFLGQVATYDAGLVKLTGRAFTRDALSGDILRKSDVSTKIVSLSSGTLIVYQLPSELDVEAMEFRSSSGRVSLTDGRGFVMNLTEAPHGGAL
jgi:hypothetical protein